MQTDLDLVLDEQFSLGAPTTDDLDRIRNRFRIQFLSYRRNNRGSTFVNGLRNAQIRTNAAVITYFSQSAVAIVADMQRLAQDIRPLSVVLDDFTTSDFKTITLFYTVNTSRGSVQDSLVVDSVVVEQP